MKAAFLVASAAASLAWLIKPAQAALFNINLENSNNNIGSGILFFEDSPLTGMGVETAEISQLEDAIFFLGAEATPSPLNNIPLLFFNNPATFDFNDGELTGITSTSELAFEETTSDENIETIQELEYTLSLQGKTYQQSTTGTQTFSGEFDDIIELYDNEITAAGNIAFTTIEPVEAVPEPLTILGTATALGFGTFFKRKLSRQSSSAIVEE